ncbi:uncharacterized protein LOC110229266 [Arabidopsis lyrata subsp. lyrata]|uniref:uncharacterized protein LOC110229266 n=1 Tax=Arabidopsis lyrata subsp. lyrata TaxID=81972 RepID=UPI000A29BDFA|nr:uncharacterized protein LOC110229266 [Arabidopsis lyrata subsp. lyrata]|eukprot:XP_020884682.1 uncharacterized protein LOC110229266 [Arabidopsis lyrata subsp. lyrata]
MDEAINCTKFQSDLKKLDSLVFSRISPRQRLFCSWAELLSWRSQASPTAPSILRKKIAQVVVYNIRRQRNNALHNSQRLSPPLVFKLIDHEVRNIISARRKRKWWRDLMLLWIR